MNELREELIRWFKEKGSPNPKKAGETFATLFEHTRSYLAGDALSGMIIKNSEDKIDDVYDCLKKYGVSNIEKQKNHHWFVSLLEFSDFHDKKINEILREYYHCGICGE